MEELKHGLVTFSEWFDIQFWNSGCWHLLQDFAGRWCDVLHSCYLSYESTIQLLAACNYLHVHIFNWMFRNQIYISEYKWNIHQINCLVTLSPGICRAQSATFRSLLWASVPRRVCRTVSTASKSHSERFVLPDEFHEMEHLQHQLILRKINGKHWIGCFEYLSVLGCIGMLAISGAILWVAVCCSVSRCCWITRSSQVLCLGGPQQPFTEGACRRSSPTLTMYRSTSRSTQYPIDHPKRPLLFLAHKA